VSNQPKTDVLSVANLSPLYADPLKAAYSLHQRLNETDPAAFAQVAPRIAAIAASGESKVGAELIEQLPALKIISVMGVGYDGIDVAAAKARGVVVTHTPGVLNDDVADLALALMLALSRQIARADRFVRAGQWSSGPLALGRKMSGARLGIVGMGRIGQAIAYRAAAFNMAISYTARSAKTDLPYTYHPTPAAPPVQPPPQLPLFAGAAIQAVVVKGSLTTSVVARAVERLRPEFSGCYARAAHAAGRNGFGAVSVEVQIDEQGALSMRLREGGASFRPVDKANLLAEVRAASTPTTPVVISADGKVPYESVMQVMDELRNGACIGIFPEGTRSLGRELRARSGFGRLAQAVPEAEVVCVSVTGTVDIPRFPKRPLVRVRFFRPAEGGLSNGEDPAALAPRLLAEIRAQAPIAVAGRRRRREPVA